MMKLHLIQHHIFVEYIFVSKHLFTNKNEVIKTKYSLINHRIWDLMYKMSVNEALCVNSCCLAHQSSLCSNVTCSGVTGKTSSATSDWFQIVQTNSVSYNYHVALHSFVQTLNGRQVLIDTVCRMDEWFTNKLLPVACPWQIESIDLVDYHWP